MDRFRVESAPVIPLSMKNVFDGANHLGISVQFVLGSGTSGKQGKQFDLRKSMHGGPESWRVRVSRRLTSFLQSPILCRPPVSAVLPVLDRPA